MAGPSRQSARIHSAFYHPRTSWSLPQIVTVRQVQIEVYFSDCNLQGVASTSYEGRSDHVVHHAEQPLSSTAGSSGVDDLQPEVETVTVPTSMCPFRLKSYVVC
jgi:hypothetical protein